MKNTILFFSVEKQMYAAPRFFISYLALPVRENELSYDFNKITVVYYYNSFVGVLYTRMFIHLDTV